MFLQYHHIGICFGDSYLKVWSLSWGKRALRGPERLAMPSSAGSFFWKPSESPTWGMHCFGIPRRLQ